MSQRLAYSISEAARLIGISARSLRYLMQTGRLGFSKVGRRTVIPRAELEILLRKALVKPAHPLDADEPIRPRGGNTKAPSTNTRPSA